jgi:RHS repeat-associated protein
VTYAYDKDNRLTTMVDSAGTTTYGYGNGLLASENGPWADDTVSYAYSNGQRQSLTLLQPNASAWVESYGYDGGRRLTSVTSAAGTFGYTYAGPGSLVTNLALPGSWAITNQYDSVGRLTGTWLRGPSGVATNEHLYTYNAGSQRTRQTRFARDYVDYTYDAAGQLKTAVGRESGGATNRLAEQFGYAYDAGGNLQYRTNNAMVQTFSVDNVNQLTNVARTGTLTVAGGTTAAATSVTVKDNANSAVAATLYADKTFARSGVSLLDGTNTFTAVATDSYGRGDTNTVTVSHPASVSYTFDDNGNLTSDGQQSYEYDGENQLVAVQVAESWRSEFRYDGKLRRRVRVEKVWQNSQWATASETRYIYDGMLVIQDRDANNLPAVSYTRGRDLSGTREGAGGIGGLLARTDHRLLVAGDPAAHACYHADGNGNITALANSTRGIVARYLYDPYGNLLAKAGSLADANLHRFSSKEIHASSSLYYYGYRFYAPSLQRWLNRDPLNERGGLNLYCIVGNSPLGVLDSWGLGKWSVKLKQIDMNKPGIGTTQGASADENGFEVQYIPDDNECPCGAQIVLYQIVSSSGPGGQSPHPDVTGAAETRHANTPGGINIPPMTPRGDSAHSYEDSPGGGSVSGFQFTAVAVCRANVGGVTYEKVLGTYYFEFDNEKRSIAVNNPDNKAHYERGMKNWEKKAGKVKKPKRAGI